MAPVLLALLLPNVAHRAQRKFSVPEAGGTVSLPAGTAVMLPLDGCEAGSTSGTMRLVFAVRAHVDSRQSVVHQMANGQTDGDGQVKLILFFFSLLQLLLT